MSFTTHLLFSIAFFLTVHGSVILPSTWSWTSSNILVDVKSDPNHNVQSVKDPSIVFFDNHYHVYATIHTAARGWSIVYFNFTSFSEAHNAPWYYMDYTPGFSGYKCAPQLFYFTPHRLWYLVFQSPWPTYSTNAHPGNPAGWSSPKTMFTNMPNNAIDFFTICNNFTCFLYFSDDGGDWFRATTSKSAFPGGWAPATLALKSSNKFTYFEGSWVYKLTTQEEYFAGIEGIGSDGNRYYQSFTASSLDGTWTELAPSFATHNVVKYPTPWNTGISHGELIRASYDEFLELNPCGINFLYQGVDPHASGPYESLPYKLGLLTATNHVTGC